MRKDELPTYKVLLTGFEPFGYPKPDFNPSWLLASHFNDSVLETADFKLLIKSYELPVKYEDLPLKLDVLTKEVNYDFIIHLGQGYQDRIAIETLAVSHGYYKLDNNNKCALNLTVPANLNPSLKPNLLITKVNIDSLVKNVNEQTIIKGPKVMISYDPGRYLCEFCLYCSLAKVELDQKKTKVIFVHVPKPDYIFSLEYLKEVVKSILINLPKSC